MHPKQEGRYPESGSITDEGRHWECKHGVDERFRLEHHCVGCGVADLESLSPGKSDIDANRGGRPLSDAAGQSNQQDRHEDETSRGQQVRAQCILMAHQHPQIEWGYHGHEFFGQDAERGRVRLGHDAVADASSRLP